MKKIISYDPKSACKQLPTGAAAVAVVAAGASTTEGAKGQPSLPVLVDDDDDRRNESTCTFVTTLMVGFFFISVIPLSTVDSHAFTIVAFVFLYATVMINLMFFERRNEAKKKRELQACTWIRTAKGPELTSILMMIATGITLTSLGVMVYFFRPKWGVLAIIALVVSVSTAFTLLFMIGLEESERKKKALGEKCEDASDLV